jgi:large subunit ribosomal protein L10
MKSRAVKHQDLERLREQFAEGGSLFLVEFDKLKSVAVDDLRRKVRESKARYEVVKNTLARKASAGTAAERLAPHFRGPTALVAVADDPSSVAKTLRDFAKTNPGVALKAGLVEGTALSAAECEALADIPSREELLARLLRVLQSPMQRLATVLAAPSRNLAVVLSEGARKKEGSEA